jgi:uncharacterized membrane protein/mono/diheme cytochrome c family protein
MLPNLDLAVLEPLAPMLAESGPQLGRAAGRLHPLVVHFPLALGLVAIGAEWWRGLSRREGMSPLTLPLLWIAAISAVASTATGWVNASYERGSGDDAALDLHRWIGTATTAGFVVLAWWCQILAAQATASTAKTMAALGTFRWAALVGGIAMSVTGHLGGDLVHGKGYLTDLIFPPAKAEEAPKEAPKESANIELSANDRFFLDKVRPIFEANCFECHGARKQKGGLRMDSKSWLFNGSEEKWSVHPGKAGGSLLVTRVELDRADPDAMPPEGDGLTADEKAIIRKWIDDGAAYPDVSAIGGGIPGAAGVSTAQVAAAGALALSGPAPVAVAPGVKAKADVAAKALIARGVLVQPLAAESPLFDVNASRAEPAIGDADAALLADIAPLVANLNLSKSTLTDAGLAKLGGMVNLERLRLDGTGVGDAGVRALGSLPKLESINLIGTKVSPALTDWLTAQSALRRIYVWQTALDATDALKALNTGGRQAIGADLPLAEPKGPPMPEDAPAAEKPADKPA